MHVIAIRCDIKRTFTFTYRNRSLIWSYYTILYYYIIIVSTTKNIVIQFKTCALSIVLTAILVNRGLGNIR